MSFVVDSVECTGAELVMETSKPGKLPLSFEIAQLKVSNVTSNGAMNFEAELTNPRPRGTIHTAGTLGPWPRAASGEFVSGATACPRGPRRNPPLRRLPL